MTRRSNPMEGIILQSRRKDRPRNSPLRIPAPGTFGCYPEGDAIADRLCDHCKKPIGYDRLFWFLHPTGQEVVHSSCLAPMTRSAQAASIPRFGNQTRAA